MGGAAAVGEAAAAAADGAVAEAAAVGAAVAATAAPGEVTSSLMNRVERARPIIVAISGIALAAAIGNICTIY